MSRLIGFLGLSALLLPFAATDALACTVPGFQTYPGQTAIGTMFAFSGRGCSVTLGSSLGPIHSVRVSSAPRNGSASVQGHRVIYVSKSGFSGTDQFTYVRQGLDTINKPISITVQMNVQVSPAPPGQLKKKK